MTRFALYATLTALLLAMPARAVEVDKLYWSETVVTGKEEPERSRGFGLGLEEVLGKLSGIAELPRKPALEEALAAPGPFVTKFEYEDRMKGIPVHDEQGTRERPHYLRMTFDEGKVDALLEEIGLRKWRSDRPRIAVLLRIRDAVRTYLLTEDGEHGYGQREVLRSAAGKRGLPILLPRESDREAAGYEAARPRIGAATRLQARMAADGMLIGVLLPGQEGLYWDVTWVFEAPKDPSNPTETWALAEVTGWSLDNVTFDKALRDAVDRAARLLATRGSPK